MDAMRVAGAGAAGLGMVAGARLVRRLTGASFKDRVVVITGGSRGLGLALARRFADEGARMAILARDAAELERAHQDLHDRGADVLAVICDVRDRQAVQSALDGVAGLFGRIDVLVNNAGEIQVGPVEHMQIADYEASMGDHFWGPLYATQAVLPGMKERHNGHIVNISSIGGLVAVPHLLPYCASKFALTGLSDGMRAELAKDGIKVTTVCPGLMRTGSHLNAQFKGQQPREFTLFSLIAAQPVSSIAADRAARQIVDACRHGSPRLVITTQARLLAMSSALAPNLVARLMALAVRTLPGPTGPAGDALKTGWESETRLSPSPLTHLADKATVEYNGLRGHASVASDR